MPAISFPANPLVNDIFTSNGRTWTWNGTFWSLVVAVATNAVTDGSITTAKLADSAVTAAKIADGTVVAAEIANNAITQAKLATSLSAVTITTSANRDAAVPSPFTGQLVFLTDTKKVQVWDGSLWLNITLAPPEPPTSLSATALSTTSISVSFTAGGANGSPITNYKYALSTNGGSSYGAFTALDPADATSPITISGLTAGTTYHIKLKAVNDMGDSAESSATSVSTLATPDAPTGLSASNIGATTVTISFTAGAQGGSAISNYQYALSTNGGSTYGSFTALNPADATSPITITGLTSGTAYYVKLKAVNNDGAGAESSAVSFTTLASTFATNYLVVAGGGGGGSGGGSGGGAGGLRSTVTATGGDGPLESALSLAVNTNYAVAVGGGGNGGAGGGGGYNPGTSGTNSTFSNIVSNGGGYGTAHSVGNAGSGGSGGGGVGHHPNYRGGGAGTANQGFRGGNATANMSYASCGGGGAGAQAADGNQQPTAGGNGVAVAITGSSVTYAGGGGGGSQGGYNTAPTTGFGAGGAGGGGAGATLANGTPGTSNTGGGGGGGGYGVGEAYAGAAGGSGVIILRYPSAYTITIGAGLTGTTATVGSDKVTTFTSGSGNVSWS